MLLRALKSMPRHWQMVPAIYKMHQSAQCALQSAQYALQLAQCALQSAQNTVTLQVTQYCKTTSLCLVVFRFVVLRSNWGCVVFPPPFATQAYWEVVVGKLPSQAAPLDHERFAHS